MTATPQHFQDLFFSTGKMPHGSVREYYTEVTDGLITSPAKWSGRSACR